MAILGHEIIPDATMDGVAIQIKIYSTPVLAPLPLAIMYLLLTFVWPAIVDVTSLSR